MNARIYAVGLLMGAASVALAAPIARSPTVDAGESGTIADDAENAALLLDPAFLAGGICGGGAANPGAFFKPRLILAAAQAGTQPAATAVVGEKPVPLWNFLGDLTYPVTTAQQDAQRYFDQGLRLAYAFNHAEALRAFRQAQRIDPDCAMCYWGEAYVLGPNINAPMPPEAVAPAMAAIGRAQALAANATEREQALIAAMARRYSAESGADRSALDSAYADAMAEVARRFPDDPEIAGLFAEAMMDVQPWDYWEADARTPKGRMGDAITAVERVLARNPDHPFAIHLYIHLVEASTTPERAEPYADRLGAAMPGAGHMIHMPGHIYFRVGRHMDALASNHAAVSADEYFFGEAGDAVGPIYRFGYYPHNVHFLVESARLVGDGPASIEAAGKLQSLVPDEAARAVAWLQAVKAAPYYAHAQFSDRATVMALPDPGDGLAFVRGAWHYARAVALAQAGDADGARAEAKAMADIAALDEIQALPKAGMPGPDVLRIAGLLVDGRIARAEGDLPRAIAAFEQAAAVQDGIPYMEPPFWYYPVRQTLGATLLEAGRTEEAERAFRQALVTFPHNAWSLYGLREAQAARGDTAGAAETAKLLEKVWGADRRLELARL
ncbi:tetratricopeptide repeat protein [Arenibaculum pallidiluteum]|uniref:tetratricopeptide repeat protein n=1 Tax=Arenibaculum pallidiluteum TaxID=2812559 RepID=UPI001A959B1A|nr:tetratricopeptide repeat protein [Arenibaculum pallidiluteum]